MGFGDFLKQALGVAVVATYVAAKKRECAERRRNDNFLEALVLTNEEEQANIVIHGVEDEMQLRESQEEREAREDQMLMDELWHESEAREDHPEIVGLLWDVMVDAEMEWEYLLREPESFVAERMLRRVRELSHRLRPIATQERRDEREELWNLLQPAALRLQRRANELDDIISPVAMQQQHVRLERQEQQQRQEEEQRRARRWQRWEEILRDRCGSKELVGDEASSISRVRESAVPAHRRKKKTTRRNMTRFRNQKRRRTQTSSCRRSSKKRTRRSSKKRRSRRSQKRTRRRRERTRRRTRMMNKWRRSDLWSSTRSSWRNVKRGRSKGLAGKNSSSLKRSSPTTSKVSSARRGSVLWAGQAVRALG